MEMKHWLDGWAVTRKIGGPGSGHHGHGGRPGRRGGSSKRIGIAQSLFDTMRGFSTLKDMTDGELRRLAKVGAETQEIYGSPSRSPATDAYRTNTFVLGATRFASEHPYAEALQKECLASRLPIDEVLYRGVSGFHADELRSLEVGESFSTGRHFLGASRSKEVAAHFAGEDGFLFAVQVHKGQAGRFIGPYASEILLPAGSVLKKVSKTAFEVVS